MRTRNALERLTAAGRPLLSEADSLVDEEEKNRMFARIVATGRSAGAVHRRRRAVLAVVGVVVLGAVAAVIALETVPGSTQVTRPAEHHKFALSGPKIQLAGYSFKLPAGYASSGTCEPPAASTPGNPNTVIHTMRSAASAEGGCIDVAILDRSWTPPPDAQAVSVGSYAGFLVPGDPQEALFVQIPVAQGDQYLVVTAEGLNVAQLIAIAESGLPASG